MGYTPTVVQQGSAQEFRAAINENFEDIQSELIYTQSESQTISLKEEIDNINEKIGNEDIGDMSITEKIIDVETNTATEISAIKSKIGHEATETEAASGLVKDIRGLQDDVNNLETVVLDNTNGLVKKFDNLNKIKLYNNGAIQYGKEIKFYLTDLRV